MKKGDEVFVQAEDSAMERVLVTGVSQRGIKVVWLSGPLKGRDALIEKQTFADMARRAR